MIVRETDYVPDTATYWKFRVGRDKVTLIKELIRVYGKANCIIL